MLFFQCYGGVQISDAWYGSLILRLKYTKFLPGKLYYLPTFPYSRVSRFFARGFNKFNQFSHGTPWQTLDIVSFKSENLKTWHSSQKIHGFYLYQSAAMKMSKFMITNIFWSKLVAWHYRHRGSSRVRKGQRGNVFRITVWFLWCFFFHWFFNGLHGSHDSLALILYTYSTLFGRFLCHHRSINVVKQARNVVGAFNLSLSPNFFVLYLFSEGFWRRNGLILKGMWEFTDCKQSSTPLTKVEKGK